MQLIYFFAINDKVRRKMEHNKTARYRHPVDTWYDAWACLHVRVCGCVCACMLCMCVHKKQKGGDPCVCAGVVVYVSMSVSVAWVKAKHNKPNSYLI